MSTKRIIIAIIALALILLTFFKLKSNKETTESKVNQYDPEKPVLVEAEEVRFDKIGSEMFFSGTFEHNRETNLSTDSPGKINKMLVQKGSYVNQGQALIQLDNSLLKLQLKGIDVQIEGLKEDIKRYGILAAADAIQGVQLEKTELGLKTAEVQRETVVEQINKTTIRAPFSGIVTEKFNDEGGFAGPGAPLLQITDISNLKFTIHVSEKDINRFKVNQTYIISPDLNPENRLSGKVILVGSRTIYGGTNYPVQFLVKNTQGMSIKSGMFGKVHLDEAADVQGISIPSKALIGSGGKSQVYLLKNNKAILHEVVSGRTIKNRIEITEGLHAGDRVITKGFINLRDSSNVTVK